MGDALKVCLLVFRTGQMEAMVAFYRTIGLEFRLEQHGSGPLHYAADVGGMVLELYPRPAESGGGCADATMAGLRVVSVDATVNALRRLGARVVTEPRDGPWGRRALVADRMAGWSNLRRPESPGHWEAAYVRSLMSPVVVVESSRKTAAGEDDHPILSACAQPANPRRV